jgi:O-antigen/teichoic acid export membrane protein
MIVGQVVATAVSYAVAPRVPRFVMRGPGVSRLVHFGRWSQATRVLMFVGLYLDNALVGKVLGTSALGLYQIAFRIGEIPINTLGGAAAQVMLPALTRLRPYPRRLRREYGRMVRLIVAANAGLALAIVCAVRPVVTAFLGPEWLPAVTVAQVLAVAMVLRNVMLLGNQLLYAVERPRLVFAVNGARVFVLGVTIAPLLRRFGILGVALSVLASCLAAALASVAATRACLATAGSPPRNDLEARVDERRTA